MTKAGNPSDYPELDGSVTIGGGYPSLQLAKALQTADDQNADFDIQERAHKKATQWVSVLRGMLDGSITVGSRTPVADTPAWLTLEVVTGGFATGGLIAGGPLSQFEQELLGRRSSNRTLPADRKWLNTYFLSEEGMGQLTEQLDSGCYEIAAPEEGALLVVAWLLRNGQAPGGPVPD